MKHFFSTLFAVFFSAMAFGQANILDARQNYSLGQTVTLTGVITNGAEMGGSVRYMQDATAGIAVFPGNTWTGFTEPQRGDIITVTGPLTEFNGLLEVGPGLTEVVIVSSGNELPAPISITPNQMNESNEGRLAKIDNVVFNNGGANFAGNSTYQFTSNGQNGVIYVRNGSVLVGQMIPAGPVELTGIVSQFSFTGVGGYQLLPRDGDDVQMLSGINLFGQVDQQNIQTTSFSLHWNTDTPGDSKVEYGLTPGNLNMETYNPASVTNHSATLTNLQPGTIYYARVISSDGEDTAESSVMPYATKSLSSGDITVYFNGSVLTQFASVEQAIGLGADTNDTIAAYIDRAMYTLDMAIYNINDQLVVNAINAAYTRGVQIRYIAEGQTANLGVGQFNNNIPVAFRTDGGGSGMHNKFIIIDADHTDRATLITGSTNMTTNNLNEDYNNIIIFQDESICKGYRIEFEEMWGSSSNLPAPGNAKFGPNKTINTPKKYMVGNTPVDVFFSPSDNTTNAIRDALLTTNTSLEFCLLAFTQDVLAETVIFVNDDFFTYVRGIIEQTSGTGADFDMMVAAGVEVYSHQGVPGQLHHKYAIIDAADPDSDPMVVTGSHNWSASAENQNDENTVIVRDARVANLFFQEFMARYAEFVEISVEDISFQNEMVLFPNPAREEVTLVARDGSALNGTLALYDSFGRMAAVLSVRGSLARVSLSGLPSGFYMATYSEGGSQKWSGKLIKE
jgi:phosphatidylserine/phosphatidylglycerophosphate/cardiolipin synthase-like enzyme